MLYQCNDYIDDQHTYYPSSNKFMLCKCNLHPATHTWLGLQTWSCNRITHLQINPPSETVCLQSGISLIKIVRTCTFLLQTEPVCPGQWLVAGYHFGLWVFLKNIAKHLYKDGSYNCQVHYSYRSTKLEITTNHWPFSNWPISPFGRTDLLYTFQWVSSSQSDCP